nr:mid1-interacting protein 1-B-like [Pogona vitticeps]
MPSMTDCHGHKLPPEDWDLRPFGVRCGLDNSVEVSTKPANVPVKTMEEYFSAVRKMEQTVMFPSLLQGAPLAEQANTLDTDSNEKDLYEYYMLLKSIKTMVEGGLVPLNNQTFHIAAQTKEQEIKEEDDLEDLFYYHVSSLYRVLTQLTRRANAVTSKYNEIMGQMNQNEKRLSF